ncbi:hypothetical protein OG413_21205 [Streptomyces sp. NBC_01433]|uniref:hypothetical protein n=1 Tax=Streptomyces sp. NBC_01433 TaxID=2903864 RepID=UPI0022501AE7|nr:hypothetical protein [Streptomyces sp. NBC_01433]MCX4677796.1 hypothetical protein [Streptomyces sp. NBC_01433]
MTGPGVRGVRAVLLAASVASAAAGCSDEGNSPSGAVSKAASAAASVASRGSDVVASATAAAQDKLNEFKDGVDAKGEVKLGTVGKDSDGRSTAKFTVTNGTDSAKSYVVQINFRDKGGNLLDTTVVTVDDAQPAKPKDATARSNRKLDGDVKAEVATALRH